MEAFFELIDVLKLEMARYRKLFSLAENQREILVAGKIDELTANVRLAEKEVFALNPLVSKRNEVLGLIAKSHRLPSVDLKKALDLAPLEAIEDLKKTVIELGKAAQDLETLNKGNEKLLNNAMAYVNFSLKLIKTGGRKQSFRSNQDLEEKGPSFVDRVV